MNALNIAIIGNPNSGKSSLFNALTGLDQKVANFPGVTIDKKMGTFILSSKQVCNIVDLPGIYSLYPKKEDEKVSYNFILEHANTLDFVIVTVDAANLKRNLLFCSQIIDMKIPVIIALTMNDIARKKKIQINIPALERLLGTPIIDINPRKNKGIVEIKKAIEKSYQLDAAKNKKQYVRIPPSCQTTTDALLQLHDKMHPYLALHYAIYPDYFTSYEEDIIRINTTTKFNKTLAQAEDIQSRYKKIESAIKQSVVVESPIKKELQTHRLDSILLHRNWGYPIMFFVLFIVFQSVFWLAQFPMNGIEFLSVHAVDLLEQLLPDNTFSNFITNGLLSGITGIIIFIPQIIILSALIGFLEDSGYMARISFLTDKIMRYLGLNGKSVVPLISGLACAVPAIMGTRNIENKTERLITIFVLPLISCSARLPVFTVLIALAVPNVYVFNFISLQGLALMLCYFAGFILAFCVAFVMKLVLQSKEKSFFILELPFYKSPRWKNLLTNSFLSAKIFVLNAGKVIMIISVLLWGLSSFGLNTEKIKQNYAEKKSLYPQQKEQLEQEEKTALLENSFAGQAGKFIEPVIAPLGFDWKIGIALITSFAAREVFVGTMATLYSLDENKMDSQNYLQEKLQTAKRGNGQALFSVATTFSLLLFYLISLQCMSTIAIVKRETKSWRFATLQFVVLTAIAYALSFFTFQLLS